MTQQHFGVTVIPAMAGFFFGKRAKVQEVHVEKTQLPAVINEPLGETGVTRYLMAAPVISSVTKFLKKKDKTPVSGVSVYLLRQSIAERNNPKSTNVAKYLSKVAKDTSRNKTCVDKYLLNKELTETKKSSLTGVARYQADQDLVSRKQAAAAMIQKYREQEATELLARQAAQEAGSHFSEDQILAAETDVIAEETAATSVGRYLQKSAKKVAMPTTGVARYIATQIILESQKPVLSKVSLYMRDQAINQSKKPKLTGVARYLSKLPPVTEKASYNKGKAAPSGVSRYLDARAVSEINKPSLSGVAKYLESKSKEEASKIKKIEDLRGRMAGEPAVKSIEGEFIPANSYHAETGVSRYLERMGDRVDLSDAISTARVTGVSRYLDKLQDSVSDALAVAPTGVDRYLLRRVS
ncbi:hypothetical protein MCAMS1_00656 [biofilm metagenome]